MCLVAANTGCFAAAIVIAVPVWAARVRAAAMVAGLTVAVVGVTVMVSVTLVPATETVNVTGRGVAFIAATFPVPAMTAAAGAMLRFIAARAAAVLPVSAARPMADPATSLTCVLPLSSHRCSEP